MILTEQERALMARRKAPDLSPYEFVAVTALQVKIYATANRRTALVTEVEQFLAAIPADLTQDAARNMMPAVMALHDRAIAP
jgi:hypothetical protein